MKLNFKLLGIALAIMTFTSCLVDDDPILNNDSGPNIAGFARTSQNLSAVSDGNEYEFGINVLVKGPTVMEMTEDVTLTVSADPASTAVEGVHYRFESNTITLTEGSNYLGTLPITVITEGIEAPLPENPILILQATDAQGNNVVANGNDLTLTFVYQCYADLSGTYVVTNDWCSPSFTVEITANPDGSWHLTSADGGGLSKCTSNSTLANAGNITELCGEILPSGSLDFGSDNFSGAIGDITGGTWDAENGVLTLSHTQDFTGNWPSSWNSTYTRQ